MSRVGKVPVKILQGVKVDFKDGLLKVEGPKGKLQRQIPVGVELKMENGSITVNRREDLAGNAAALHGLVRTLVSNMVHGVATGFSKELEIVGVGYRAAMKGQTLNLTVG